MHGDVKIEQKRSIQFTSKLNLIPDTRCETALRRLILFILSMKLAARGMLRAYQIEDAAAYLNAALPVAWSTASITALVDMASTREMMFRSNPN